MPDSFEEAVSQGTRRGLRNLLANFLGQLGKGLAWLLFGVVFIFIALWVVDLMWDGFTSPFRDVWSWTTGKFDGGVDWVTSLVPGGDTAVEPSVVVEIEEVANDVPSEPGIICRNTGGWNLFCD